MFFRQKPPQADNDPKKKEAKERAFAQFYGAENPKGASVTNKAVLDAISAAEQQTLLAWETQHAGEKGLNQTHKAAQVDTSESQPA